MKIPSKWRYHFWRRWQASLFTCQQGMPGRPSPSRHKLYLSFDLCLNKRLSKQSWGWWFETPLCVLWRHCNDLQHLQFTKRKNVFCLLLFNYWLHWKLSKWQLPVQPMMKIPSKWRYHFWRRYKLLCSPVSKGCQAGQVHVDISFTQPGRVAQPNTQFFFRIIKYCVLCVCNSVRLVI